MRRAAKRNIHIGTSVLNPASFLLEYWQKVYRELEDIDIRLVSFDTDFERYSVFLKNFGNEIDLIAGITSEEFKQRAANAATLFCAAIPSAAPCRIITRWPSENGCASTICSMKR